MSGILSAGGAGAVGVTGGVAQQSLKFNDDESQYLSWTPATAGNTTTYTVSFWIKGFDLREQSILAAENGASQTFIKLRSDGQIQFGAWNGSGYDFNLRTTALHRDPSAFYHFVCVMDGGNGTSGDRQRIYVNGERLTSFTHETYTASGQEINTAVTHYLGRLPAAGSSQYLSAYLSNIHFIDGQALDPTSFGQFTNGYWEKKDYAGSYGTNGFHLTFADDVVSEGFNAVTYKGTGAAQSISGLGFEPDFVWFKRRTADDHDLQDSVRGGGKTLITNNTTAEANLSGSYGINSFDADGFSLVGNGGRTNESGGSYVAWAWDAGDVTSLVTNGDFSNGTTGWTANNCSASVNSDGRLAATYSSSGAYVYQLLTTVVGKTYAITYNNYQAADFVFVHATSPTGTQIASSNSSGTAPILFTATTTTTSIRFDIPNGQTRIIDDVQVFEANTDGTITSTVKANPDYGFSIVSYTGTFAAATVGHGLSSAPELIIVKNRSTASNWWVGSDALGGWDKYLGLDLTSAVGTATSIWNGTAPTSTVFSVANDGGSNGSGNSIVAYCFNSVAGYSKISSYSGTGAAGNAVTTGFRPAFVMIKRTDNAQNWRIYDNTRDTTNPRNILLFPDGSGAEATSSTYDIDFDADGFTLNGTNAASNGSGGTYIYMAFADTREAAFWKDVSGQGNHWTPNNLDYRDSLPDSPANNWATFNALNLPASAVLSEGNLKFTQTLNDRAAAGNMAISSGKWYFEVYYTAGTNPETGLAPISQSYANSGATGSTDKLLFITNSTGMRTPAWSTTDTTGLSAQTGTTILGFAVDADNGKMFISANGTYFNSGDPAVGTNPQGTFDADWLDQTGGGVVPFSGIYTGTSGEVRINFGQDSTFAGAKPMGAYTDDSELGTFQYQPPVGFNSLCSQNLTTPTIIDGSTAFNTVLYTGTGATQSITGVGFGSAPDFVWIKDRTTAYDHHLFDVVRGGGNSLYSNDSVAENTYATDITFDADGFTIADGSTTPQIYINKNTDAFASWNWKAGGAAVSNTDGSITSQVSANVDAGFSVLTYSPSGSSGSVGHGLGVTPSVVIVKRRDTTGQWVSHWSAISGTNKQLYLNNTNAVDTNNISSLTSTTFTVSGWSEVATAGGSYVAYCFADVEGFSKVGSYTGNGSTDGTFVYTGFRPAWVMVKRTDASDNWVMQDSARGSFNPDLGWLYADIGAAEESGSSRYCDFVSNGFKLRNGGTSTNTSGGTYIYLAFAENPFKYSNAR